MEWKKVKLCGADEPGTRGEEGRKRPQQRGPEEVAWAARANVRNQWTGSNTESICLADFFSSSFDVDADRTRRAEERKPSFSFCTAMAQKGQKRAGDTGTWPHCPAQGRGSRDRDAEGTE